MSGNNLVVYLGKQEIALLSLQQDVLVWQYTPAWQSIGFPVSPHLPLSNTIPTININRFLRNWLPEGPGFDELLQNVHVTRNNTFALVRALGQDTPGALILRPSETPLPQDGTFRLLAENELIERLNNRNITGLIVWDNKPRLSVAGIQDKINIMVNSCGQLGFGEGTFCSTHILKFERKTQFKLVKNEFLTMCLAKACGLQVANVQLKRYGKHDALLVERFDRKQTSDIEVKRRHIIDGCQALNLSPEYKYERNFGSNRDVAHIRDGASLPLLFDFANQCQDPALTKQQILDWVLFNILVYNFDAHGKNISFYVGSHGISLAPFYDLVNIKLYSNFDRDMAMALGEEFSSDCVHAYQIADFADSCKLLRLYVAKRLKEMIRKMMIALPHEIAKMQDTYFDDYQKIITKRCEHLLKQCQSIPKITL
jgi:serine/threonine-protein kinase HipA